MHQFLLRLGNFVHLKNFKKLWVIRVLLLALASAFVAWGRYWESGLVFKDFLSDLVLEDTHGVLQTIEFQEVLH